MTASPQASASGKAAESLRLEKDAERCWNQRLLWVLMALTFGTGIVDAVGYLALDHVFIGNMTGNVAILGMAIAGGDGLPVVGPLAAMLPFSAGAAVTGLALQKKPAGWSASIAVSLLLAGLLMAGVGVTALLVHASPGSGTQILMSSLAAVAMGIQAYVARRLAVREMTTVVVTSTLTALAGELLFASSSRLFNRRTTAILAILLGAAAGTLLIGLSTALALFVSAAIMIAAALAGQWAAKRRTLQDEGSSLSARLGNR